MFYQSMRGKAVDECISIIYYIYTQKSMFEPQCLLFLLFQPTYFGARNNIAVFIILTYYIDNNMHIYYYQSYSFYFTEI